MKSTHTKKETVTAILTVPLEIQREYTDAEGRHFIPITFDVKGVRRIMAEIARNPKKGITDEEYHDVLEQYAQMYILDSLGIETYPLTAEEAERFKGDE